MENNPTLEDLRKRIDEIDSEIFSLLESRLKIVDKVGKLKSVTDPNASIIRPGREANMVKKIYRDALSKGFSTKIALAFAVLWRNIISLSVNLEEKTKILLCSDDFEVKRLSREYFGIFTEIVSERSAKEAIDTIVKGEASIAVFGVEKKVKQKPWWLMLNEIDSDLSIFAGLPFFEDGEVSTITVAKIVPEPSGEDKFVYVVEGDDAGLEIISSYNKYNLCLSNKKIENMKSLGCFAVFK